MKKIEKEFKGFLESSLKQFGAADITGWVLSHTTELATAQGQPSSASPSSTPNRLSDQQSPPSSPWTSTITGSSIFRRSTTSTSSAESFPLSPLSPTSPPTPRALSSLTMTTVNRLAMPIENPLPSLPFCLDGYDLSDCRIEGVDASQIIAERGSSIAKHIEQNSSYRGTKLCRALMKGSFFKATAFIKADMRLACLEGCSLAYADLSSATLTDSDLRAAHLDRAVLRNVSASGANFTEATLAHCDAGPQPLTAANSDPNQQQTSVFCRVSRLNRIPDFTRATELDLIQLEGAKFVRADMMFTNFENAVLCGADFSGANLSCACLKGADLRGANFAGAILKGTNLGGADLTGARGLDTCDLTHAVLIGGVCGFSPSGHKNAKDIILSQADYQDKAWKTRGDEGQTLSCNMFKEDIRGLSLDHCNLARTIFKSALLDYTDFTCAILVGADFSGARMCYVKMSAANLGACDFSSANLQRAYMCGVPANDWRQIKGLNSALLFGAVATCCEGVPEELKQRGLITSVEKTDYTACLQDSVARAHIKGVQLVQKMRKHFDSYSDKVNELWMTKIGTNALPITVVPKDQVQSLQMRIIAEAVRHKLTGGKGTTSSSASSSSSSSSNSSSRHAKSRSGLPGSVTSKSPKPGASPQGGVTEEDLAMFTGKPSWAKDSETEDSRFSGVSWRKVSKRIGVSQDAEPAKRLFMSLIGEPKEVFLCMLWRKLAGSFGSQSGPRYPIPSLETLALEALLKKNKDIQATAQEIVACKDKIDSVHYVAELFGSEIDPLMLSPELVFLPQNQRALILCSHSASDKVFVACRPDTAEDTCTGSVVAYRASKRLLLPGSLDFPDAPDGMLCAADGRLWVTMRSGIYVCGSAPALHIQKRFGRTTSTDPVLSGFALVPRSPDPQDPNVTGTPPTTECLYEVWHFSSMTNKSTVTVFSGDAAEWIASFEVDFPVTAMESFAGKVWIAGPDCLAVYSSSPELQPVSSETDKKPVLARKKLGQFQITQQRRVRTRALTTAHGLLWAAVGNELVAYSGDMTEVTRIEVKGAKDDQVTVRNLCSLNELLISGERLSAKESYDRIRAIRVHNLQVPPSTPAPTASTPSTSSGRKCYIKCEELALGGCKLEVHALTEVVVRSAHNLWAAEVVESKVASEQDGQWTRANVGHLVVWRSPTTLSH